MTLLPPKTLLNLMIFFALFSCVTAPPKAAPFDSKWTIIDPGPGQTPKACLNEDDVGKLRELLIRCEGTK